MLGRSIVASAAIVAAIASEPGSHEVPKKVTHEERYKNVGAAHERKQAMKVDAGGRALQPLAVEIHGLNFPTYLTFDDTGAMLITEKAGLVKRFQGWIGNAGPETIILDIQNQVANYGDHGLMSVAVHQGYLYAAFSRETPPHGDNCVDSGQFDGRTADQIEGCKLYGRIARWPFQNGAIVGPQQTIVDGETNNIICGQFSTHGTTMILVGPGDYIYFSVGDGASFTAPDSGQLGHNPCNDPPGYLGAFRAQNPERLTGKVMRLDPATLQYEIFAVGFRNPFRMMYWEGNLYETDTGWYTVEEVNLVQQGHNYGWPCFEGPTPQADYDFLNHPTCNYLKENNAATPPLYHYRHPENAVGNVMSISAIAGWNGRIYLGDYTQGTIWSLAPDGTDEQLMHRDSAPVGLYPTAQGLVYINYDQGAIYSLPDAGAALPSASPSPAPAQVVVTPNPPTWEANQNVEFAGSTNIEGREGLLWEWTVNLLFNCNNDGGCDMAQLMVGQAGPPTLKFQAPPVVGTLEVIAKAKTYAGTSITGTQLYVATNNQLCACTGQRNIVDAGTIGGIAPSATPSSSAKPQWPSLPPPIAKTGGTLFDGNPAALGGVIAAGAVVAIALIVAAAWMTGLPARLGLTASSANVAGTGATRREPAAAAAAAAGAAAATGAAAGATRGAANGNAQQPSVIASRRPSFSGAPPLQTEGTNAAAAPNRGVTPAGQQQQPQSNKRGKGGTPSGEKRV